MRATRGIVRLLAAAVSLSFVGASCQAPMLGLMPGVINDPKNLSLRRSMLAYGIDWFCDEVRSRSMPFRFRDEDPVVGRFFPTACDARRLPDGDLAVDLAGHGYVWTTVSLRLGFEARAAVTYDTDFQLDGSTMYVYFRPRAGALPAFYTRFVQALQSGFMALIVGSGQNMTDGYGAQMMAFQLGRGFTVIRDARGGVRYGVGVVAPGEHPPEAYTNLDPDKATLANERVEVHVNQRDFAGPFAVPEGKRLSIIASVEGAPAVDALLVSRAVGDPWLAAYTHQAQATPPPGAPLLDEVIVAGATYRRTVDVPAGQYYLVLDNTATAGRTAPPPPIAGERVVVSYAVELE